MSQTALLIACRDFIKKNLIIRDHALDSELWCEVTVDGRPLETSGQYFISLHQGGSRGSSNEVLDSYHAVYITYTMKIGDIPPDKQGPEAVLQLAYGTEDIMNWMVDNIHNNYEIINNANELINERSLKIYKDGMEYRNGFVEPLRFSNISAARLVSGEWFNAGRQQGETGITQTCIFDRARRVQYAYNQPIIGIDLYGNIQNHV